VTRRIDPVAKTLSEPDLIGRDHRTRRRERNVEAHRTGVRITVLVRRKRQLFHRREVSALKTIVVGFDLVVMDVQLPGRRG
jgi:hypothetical protein